MTNETRAPSPHKCPSCKASFTDDGEFGAHMGGQCTPSPAELIDARGLVEADLDSQVRAHIEAQSATIARLNAEVERMRGAMNECLPYLEEAYMDDEEDDEPVGWCADHDGTDQRPVALTFGMIRRFRAALAPKEG